MLGYTTEEMAGISCGILLRTGRKPQKRSWPDWRENAGTELVERNYRRKDRGLLPILIENRILHDDDGRVTGLRSTLSGHHRAQAAGALPG